MIIVRIMGGLGNQMFQYAFYRALCAKGKDARLDLSWFKHFKAHNGYELRALFDIKENLASEVECKALGEIKFDMFHRLKRKIYTKKTYYAQSVKQGICYSEQFFDMDNMYLSGYWQSEKYFSFIEDIIRKEFSFIVPFNHENSKYKDTIKSCNAVSIHIRRGDYLKNPVHGGICSLSYYQKSIQYIEKYVKNPCFFIFSDDILWCKEQLVLPQAIYVTVNTGINSYNDMRLMSLCKHNIIANSSFSWWGGWLNKYTDKIVIAPNRWFNIKDAQVNDLLPMKWIKISS